MPQAKGLPSASLLCPERAILATHPDRPPSQGHCSQVTCKGSFQPCACKHPESVLGQGAKIRWPPVISPAPSTLVWRVEINFRLTPPKLLWEMAERMQSYPTSHRPLAPNRAGAQGCLWGAAGGRRHAQHSVHFSGQAQGPLRRAVREFGD